MPVASVQVELGGRHYDQNGNTYAATIENTKFGNTICWFLIEDMNKWDEEDDINANSGCSAEVKCGKGTYVQQYKYKINTNTFDFKI